MMRYISLSRSLDSKNQVKSMKITYTYWKEADGMFLGYLNEFPDQALPTVWGKKYNRLHT